MIRRAERDTVKQMTGTVIGGLEIHFREQAVSPAAMLEGAKQSVTNARRDLPDGWFISCVAKIIAGTTSRQLRADVSIVVGSLALEVWSNRHEHWLRLRLTFFVLDNAFGVRSGEWHL